MRYLKLSVVLFFLLGCYSRVPHVQFKIENKDNVLVSNIQISNGFDQLSMDTIYPKENKQLELKFDKTPKHDGGYQVKYKIENNFTLRNFGYYTNGYPTNSIFFLTFKKDTLMIREKIK